MKVLVVSPTPFSPATAGNRRLVKNRLAQLRAAGCSIDFVYIAFEGAAPPIADADLVDRFFTVPFQWPTNRNPVLVDIDALTRQALLPDEIAGGDYDLMIVNYVFCTACVAQVKAAFVAIETHDRFGNRHELLAASGSDPSWISATVLAEAEAVSRADAVAILRDDDFAYYRALSDRPVLLLRHAEQQRAPWPDAADLPQSVRFGFVGSWNAVNRVALTSLLAAMQRLKDQVGDLRVHVFGGICNAVPEVYKPLCVMHGTVADEADLYSAFDVLVNPVFSGTGIKIKTIEALAYGKPVLSGAEGAAGFPLIPHHMALPSADAIVQEMLALSGNMDRLSAILSGARAAFEAYMAATVADFAAFLDVVARGPAPRRASFQGDGWQGGSLQGGAGQNQVRWDAAVPDPQPGLPASSLWDLLSRSQDDIADLVVGEALATQPLLAETYLPAAVVAELRGDSLRSQWLLDVHLGAMTQGQPKIPDQAAGAAARILRHPLIKPALTTTSDTEDRYRRLLADALVAGPADPAPLRAALRNLMGIARDDSLAVAATPATPQGVNVVAADAVAMVPQPPAMIANLLDYAALATEIPTAAVAATAVPALQAVATLPSASRPVPEPAATEPAVDITTHATDPSGDYQRIDAIVLRLKRNSGKTVPSLFIKFLFFKSKWLLEIHPGDSPGALVSPVSAFDMQGLGPALKATIDEKMIQTLSHRLDDADVHLLQAALRSVRDHLAPQTGTASAQLRLALDMLEL